MKSVIAGLFFGLTSFVITATNTWASVPVPVENSSAQISVFQSCLAQATGTSASDPSAAGAVGNTLTSYKSCLQNRGLSFNSMDKWWINRVNAHCSNSYYTGGLGADYNAYKYCLQERAVEPSLFTVSDKYVEAVARHCWGDQTTTEQALSWMTLIGVTLAGTPTSSVTNVAGLYEWVKFGIEIADLAMDVPGYVDEGLNFYHIDPWAVTNYSGYKQCLQDRNVTGLNFKPMHLGSYENLKKWSDLVSDHCYSNIVGNNSNLGWSANTYRQCLQAREYPMQGADGPGWNDEIQSADYLIYQAELTNCGYVYRNTKDNDPYPYLQCFNNIGVKARGAQVQSVILRNGDAVALRTNNNTYYVVAEGNGGGAANANRTAIGPWETFEVVHNNGKVAFKTSAGFYLIANEGGGSSVTAHSTYLGEWESFEPEYMGNQKFAFKTYNGSYLRAYNEGGSTLDAMARAPNIWESYSVISAPVEYRVRSQSSNKCLDVSGVSTANYAQIQQWSCAGVNNQRFIFTKQSDGTYQIKARHSGKCLDVNGASTSNGANVIQYDCHGGNNQRWYMERQSDGSVILYAKHSNKAMDVYGGSTADGGRIAQWDIHRGSNQRFYLERL